MLEHQQLFFVFCTTYKCHQLTIIVFNCGILKIHMRNSVVPNPDLSLNPVNPPRLSDQLTMECSATVVRGITSTLDFMWIRIDDDREMIVQNVTEANTTGDSLVYTDTYTTPMALRESDIGVLYLCTVLLNSDQGNTVDLNISLDTSISKYISMCVHFTILINYINIILNKNTLGV